MSRSATKSRADTRGQKASPQAASPQSQEPPVEVDVVPGRLTQTQWEDMLRLEETEDIVGGIMEELMGNIMERCLKTHTHKQLVPFSVSWAKDFLVQALELEFLYRDEGDGPEEVSMGTEESEPVPSPIDSWAQGCVPVVSISSSPPSPHTTRLETAGLEKTEPNSVRPPGTVAPLMSPPEQREEDRESSGPPEGSTQTEASPTPPGKNNRRKTTKNQLNPHTPAKESTKSPRQSLSSRLVQKGERQEEGKKGVAHSRSADRVDSLRTSEGKQPVSKRHPVLRPPQLVSPQYDVVDTQLLPKRQTVHGLPVSGHKHHQQCSVSTTIKVLQPFSNNTDKKAKLQQRRHAPPRSNFWPEPRNNSIPAAHREEGIMRFRGSLRLDTMDLVPGVSLCESRDLQKSPLTASTPVRLENIAELRPMRRYPALPMLITGQHSTGIPAQVYPATPDRDM